MTLHSFGKTHIGYKRALNQDTFLLEERDGVLLAIVCDGIGGGNGGEVASQMACAHVKDRFKSMPKCLQDVDVKRWLETTIREANDLIFMQSAKKRSLKGMGTTLVGVLVCEQGTYIFNVGDSRTYGLYAKDFLCLTEDHSYIAALLKNGQITMEEAAKHHARNVLTNALGIWDQVRIDIHKIKNDYQALLICSDGLHGYVHEDVLREILAQSISAEEKVNLLIQKALDAGGFDNISAIVLEREGSIHG